MGMPFWEWATANGAKATIYHGDSLDVLRTLPDASVDAVVTDPPYGIDYQSGRVEKERRRARIANDTQPFVWWLYDAFRVTRDGGALICFCRWDVQEAFRAAIEWAGFTVKSQVIWDRKHHGMGDLHASFAPMHDVVWFATKGDFRFPAGRPVSVVSSPRLDGAELQHPNQKPVELMAYLVRSVARAGSTVLDPFMGSGSTVVAAVQEGCNAIGIELDLDYCELAARRVQSEGSQLRLVV